MKDSTKRAKRASRVSLFLSLSLSLSSSSIVNYKPYGISRLSAHYRAGVVHQRAAKERAPYTHRAGKRARLYCAEIGHANAIVPLRIRAAMRSNERR
jgi:hypothetical protein